ncbi:MULTISPECIES: hypothetical protein [unclassified Neorhizobium]|jgi:hypothetical protein|uniref:hypothetical protein n=1 Tax=unclassified Neorhizobium TaxID=2629175 RepID=UPI000CF923C8|nr:MULTISPECIES: hypothetical protein [unclassified Neorhizobium]
MSTEKQTEGLNDRPKNAPIGQTADGLPDDSGRPVEVDDETVERTRRKLSGKPREKLLKEVRERENASRLGSE